MDSEDIIKLFDSFENGNVEDSLKLSEVQESDFEKMDTVFNRLHEIQSKMANKKIAEIEANLLQLETDLDLFLKDYVKN